MSNKSAADSNGSIAPSGRPRAIPTRPQSAVRKAQERRRALIVSCGALLVAALGAMVVVAAKSSISVHSSNSPQPATAIPDSGLRTARITKESGDDGCRQQIFDNQTGRMTESQKTCEATAYDSNGAPIPAGTIRRLDVIRKSFSGQ
jgi:hypothetical protein